MRAVFAGTPEFAVAALEAVQAAGHEIVLVLTQPDRPAGRGLTPSSSAVKRTAERLGLRVAQPATLKDPAVLAQLKVAAPDVMVVAAYGLMLPRAVLDIPRHGAINVHASLLPRWRGAAPIERAILAGDARTGVSIMQMDSGLDTGPVLLTAEAPIGRDDTAGTVHDRLAALGARLLVEVLDRFSRGEVAAAPQPLDGATYAPKIGKSEARIDWTQPADRIERQIRAFNPHPGAVAHIRGTDLKIWRAATVPDAEARAVLAAGTVLRSNTDGIVVACGEGALALTELQRAGGKRLTAAELLRGFPVVAGDRFAVTTS
ncbi:MAG: methionyl-tRNA formyltransferase [Burkholderiales bacterium]|nr:methionyl-tRNA formyltransferase [Burkholderiales bacterium]